MRPGLTHTYDVALSFAGEDRAYVQEVATALHSTGVRVFYDEYEVADLWGRDLYEHLDDVYRRLARFCVLFASRAYRDKVWTTHERRSAQARALNQDVYVLPVRLDDTEIPGLRDTIMYVDGSSTSPAALAQLVRRKLQVDQRESFLPDAPDRLWEAVGARDERSREMATERAVDFVRHISVLSPAERDLVFATLRDGCHQHLPEFVHIGVPALERILRTDRAGLASLSEHLAATAGFVAHFGRPHESTIEYTVPPEGADRATGFYLRWNDSAKTPEAPSHTDFAITMVRLATRGLSQSDGDDALRRCDFSQLSSSRLSHDPRVQPSTDRAMLG